MDKNVAYIKISVWNMTRMGDFKKIITNCHFLTEFSNRGKKEKKKTTWHRRKHWCETASYLKI